MIDSSSIENSKTFDCKVGFPIQCFTINNAGSKVIVARKVQCELYSIDYDTFTIKSKLAIKKVVGFCIMDISWSRTDESSIVTCGSNGKLYKLMLTPAGLALDTSFDLHESTINKIDYHPHDSNLLISGDQDGLIKLVDFRQGHGCAQKYHEIDDKVTDIQFNPSDLMPYQFACGTEKGFAYIWDLRNTSKYEKKLNPHLGSVHLDWHPDYKHWLATSSKDKQINVYDFSLSADPEHAESTNIIKTLTHSEGVTTIRWRPQRPTQITTCSSGFDAHLIVWDLVRPYVPYLSFDSLTNKIQNFMWRKSPKVLIASTKEHLHNINTMDAIRPTDYATPVSIQMDKYGSLAFSVGVEDYKSDQVDFAVTNFLSNLKKTNNCSSPETGKAEIEFMRATTASNQINDGLYDSNSSLSPNNLSTKSVSSTNDEFLNNNNNNLSTNSTEKFQITKSLLYFDDKLELARTDWLYYAAKNYKFKDERFEDLCEHNALICLEFRKLNLYKDWMILRTIYSDTNNSNGNGICKNSSSADIHHQVQQNLNNSQSTSNSNLNKVNSTLTDTETKLSNISNIISEPVTNPNSSQLAGPVVAVPTITTANCSSTCINSSIRNRNLSGCSNEESILIDAMNSSNNYLLESSSTSGIIGSAKTLSNNNNNRDQTNIYHQSNQIENYFDSGYLTTNSLLSLMNNVGDQQQMNDDDFLLNSINNNLYKYDDEEDYSQLPNDVIEFNDDLSNDCFLNDNKLNKDQQDLNNNKINLNNSAAGMDHLAVPLASKSRQIMPLFDLNISSNAAAAGVAETNLSNQITNFNSLLQTVTQISAIGGDSTLKAQNGAATASTTTMVNKYLDVKTISTNLANLRLNELSAIDFSDYLKQLLISYVNDENDLTTAIFMYLVLTLNYKFDPNKIDLIYLDEWFSQYIELLASFDLWNLRIDIIKHYQSDFIKSLTQNSINYNVMCGTCKKTIKKNTFICSHCNKNLFLCVFCHLPVKRLYVWCHNCFHGGHLNHLTEWFKNNSVCPSGCGCRCKF